MAVEPEDTHSLASKLNHQPQAQENIATIPEFVDNLSSTAMLHLPEGKLGLLVTAELEQVMEDCRAKVERIVKECRADNRKFRDIEFDLEGDSTLCNFGLYADAITSKAPDVRRISEIFDDPVFFASHGPHSSDVSQGKLGDCWFLAALSTIATSRGLIEKLCIARDEEVGVYGFVFFRDCYWQSIVIDDQLFWSLPKFEELNKDEQELYHEDKELYHSIARKGGRGLHYARSGTVGETWVPLIEKAYAKLHGDFAALNGGYVSEAIEDLTGGVSTIIKLIDILDHDLFWTQDLLHSNTFTPNASDGVPARFFGVGFDELDSMRSGKTRRIQGLYGSHAYSVLRAKECRGKRFVVLRNPWGKGEWKGAWSDRSGNWTGEWLEVLKELDHRLGDDGQFVMEYSDFMQTFTIITRTVIFDPSWVMSSHWIRLPPQSLLHPWTFGDVFFNFTLPKASLTILVLSQPDERHFKYVDGYSTLWRLDFVVYKRGEKEYMAVSDVGIDNQRNVSCELQLEAGEYVVYPRMEYLFRKYKGSFEQGFKVWHKRKLGRVLVQRTKARSLASNYDVNSVTKKLIPTTLKDLINVDLPTIKTTTAVTEDVETRSIGGLHRAEDESKKDLSATGEDEDEHRLFLGLRVYTKKDAVPVVTGRLKEQTE